MSHSPKPPPRFVPTLTEVVQGPDVLPVSVPVAQAATSTKVLTPAISPSAPSIQARIAVPVVPVRSASNELADVASAQHVPAPAARRPLPPGMEEYMVHRVMQRVDVVLDQRLREAIALVVQEQTRSVLPRLREEIESVVRHAVYEAVADELASGNPS